MICRKATVALPDANFLSFYAALPSSRAQYRVFCAFLPSGTPIFGRFEHKIEVFVRFCPSKPPFSSVSSTKSRFLCFFGLRNPRFRAFRAQNRGFCAFLAFGTPVFGLFEHKIGVFVLGFSILAGNYWTWSVAQRGGAQRGTYLLIIWL